MIGRYTRKEMGDVWSERAKYDAWLAVELAVCEAWARRGEIPSDAMAVIKQRAAYDLERIPAIEAEVKHDVIAFLTSVAEKIGPESRFVHMGMTSSDLLDTALATQLKRAGEILDADIVKLMTALKEQAIKHKSTPMMGRSHGIFAEPIAFGLKFAIWHDEFARHRRRLAQAIADIAVGKISGAVGTFAHIAPDIEEEVCAQLGLAPAPASSQVVQRDRHAFFFSVLACIGASVEKIAVEIRHLQRTEVFEAAEPFGKGQKGSSAMPHKRNPILSENVTGLARLLRGYATAALENVALWHERDISHSSVERVIGPDATIALDFMLARMTGVIADLDVFPENMMRNIESAHGLYASQDVLLALIRSGMTREDAYRLVQDAAMRAWDERRSFRHVLEQNDHVQKKLTAAQLDEVFDLNRHLQHVDAIYARVFGPKESR